MSTSNATVASVVSGDNLPVELWRDILEEACRILGKDEFSTDPHRYWDMPYDRPITSSRVTYEELQKALNTRLKVVLVCKSWYGVGLPILYSHFRPRLTSNESLFDADYRSISENAQLRTRVRRISIAVGVSYRKVRLAGNMVPKIVLLLSLISQPVIISAPRTIFWHLEPHNRPNVVIADLHLGAMNRGPEIRPTEGWENLRYLSILLDGTISHEFGSQPTFLPALTALEVRVARRGSSHSIPQNVCEGWHAPILHSMSLDDVDWTRWKLFLERHATSLETLNVQCYPENTDDFPSISLDNLRELWMEPGRRSYYPNTLIHAPDLQRLASHRWRRCRYQMDYDYLEISVARQIAFLTGMLESWLVAAPVRTYCISGMRTVVCEMLEQKEVINQVGLLRKRGAEVIVVSENEGDDYREVYGPIAQS